MSDPDQTKLMNPNIDRTHWGPGPWDKEPDFKEWKYKGFPCLIARSATMGALCGYVAVPPTHPWYEREFLDIRGVRVHGGLTYSDKCQEGICHKPEPGEPDDVWWVGFDTGHAGDFMPASAIRFNGEYRDMDYVIREVEQLADQAAEALWQKRTNPLSDTNDLVS